MKLQIDGVQRTLSDESLNSDNSRPHSPHSRLGMFFGWKSSSQKSPGGAESPTTSFSDRSQSPSGGLPSPDMTKPLPMHASGARLAPAGLDIHKANAHHHYFDNPDTPILIGTPETNAHVKELERELEHISSELAGSIRREMELEDEIDRMRAEAPSIPVSDMGRRSSDYFSDSGASSTRFPVTDPESKIEQMEQKLRKVEQEKAQTKNEMASRLQTELSRRADLEQMVQNMEEQLQKKFDEEDERGEMWERVEELESTLDDTRRLLSQERQAKGSFEDLYSATREELESNRNELDNLREEVVPRLRARVQGLEAEATNSQAVVYENTRMQQELASLHERLGGQFGMIAEENDGVSPINGPRSSLARSGSIARSRSMRGGSLTRSGSVKDREGGRVRSGSLTKLTEEGLREIEDQRDALHKALKLLISRYDKQQREHERAVKKLTSAKDLAEHATPKRSVYHKEVSFLKEEVTTLRKRTEDALEQKWQYEKGLSGIKMDLDRAESETRELRNLLQENDIRAPSPRTLLGDSGGEADDKLALSISTAESERDQARQLAEEYRRRAQNSPSSAELVNSAKRMDELADELDRHVESHIQLRERLTQAVTTGEREHMESSGKIEEMQKRLAGMEDSVLAAQQHSETTLGNHEAEVRRIEEATSPQLQRLAIDIPADARKLAPRSPLLSVKSPRLSSAKTKLGAGLRLADTSLLEASRTQMLERKVKELEGLLREAEQDVQEVVQRVQKSQMEVADLQMERDAALIQMRKLQHLIVEERGRADGLLGP